MADMFRDTSDIKDLAKAGLAFAGFAVIYVVLRIREAAQRKDDNE
jgi:hypothetical protein